MMNSKAYPDCPECDGINYPTFDHETGKLRARAHFAKTLNVDKVYDCEFCHPRHAKETVQKKKEAES